MPLFDSDTLSELTQSLNCLHELLQRVVAFGVKFAVLEKLVHSLLFPLFEHML